NLPTYASAAVPNTITPRGASSVMPRYRRSTRSINTPPNGGTTNPGSVTRITIKLTFTVECVAPRTYHVTPAKFIPVPNNDTNIAKKTNGNPGMRNSDFQSRVEVGSEAISESSHSRSNKLLAV